MATNKLKVALCASALAAALGVVLALSGTLAIAPPAPSALSNHIEPLLQVPVEWLHHVPAPVNIDQLLATLTY